MREFKFPRRLSLNTTEQMLSSLDQTLSIARELSPIDHQSLSNTGQSLSSVNRQSLSTSGQSLRPGQPPKSLSTSH